MRGYIPPPLPYRHILPHRCHIGIYCPIAPIYKRARGAQHTQRKFCRKIVDRRCELQYSLDGLHHNFSHSILSFFSFQEFYKGKLFRCTLLNQFIHKVSNATADFTFAAELLTRIYIDKAVFRFALRLELR